MNVLVTGGAGFIGSHLTDKLIEKGYSVSVIDDLSTGKKEYLNPGARFFLADVSDFSDIRKIGKNVRPQVVFHLAAIPRVPISIADPIRTSEVNILGTINVFKAAAECGAKRVVFASSSSVYGKQETLPFRESMTPRPMSPYGLQKRVGEEFASLFSSLYTIPIVSLRYFNVYGPRIDSRSDYGLVIGKFLSFASKGQPLTIFGTGKQTRAFCYIDDTIDATIKAATSPNIRGGEVINVGGRVSYSVLDIAAHIGGKIVYLPARSGDMPHTKADIARAKKLLGWTPRVSLKEGIGQTKAWFKKI